jgi:hypothetical protein
LDKVVDDAANNEMLSLLDMFWRYHQIRVQKKTRRKQVSLLLSEPFALPECQKVKRM